MRFWRSWLESLAAVILIVLAMVMTVAIGFVSAVGVFWLSGSYLAGGVGFIVGFFVGLSLAITIVARLLEFVSRMMEEDEE